MSADVILPARRIDWSNVGVPGGIPNRSSVFATLTPLGGGVSDSEQIQKSLDKAGADQVVLLSPGEFLITTQIYIPNRVTLRGSGTRTTRMTGSGNLVGFYRYQAWVTPVPLATTSIATKGDTKIHLAKAAPTLGKGMHIQIQEDNSTLIANGIEGNSGPWAKGQWVEVVDYNTASNTVTFTPGLYSTYDSTLNPQIRYPYLNEGGPARNFVQYAGLEYVTLINTDPYSNYNVQFGFSAYCWLRNVKSINAGICHVWTLDTYRCEIRSCTFQGILPPITSSRGYGLQTGTPNGGLPSSKTTGLLVEDNIFDGNRGHVIIGYGASGNVVGYNYFVNTRNETASVQKPDIVIHSAFPIMNLFEGNAGTGFIADNFHGNGMWNTLFRNWFKGKGPRNSSALSSVELDVYQREYTVIGNVFGYDGITDDVGVLTNPAGSSTTEDVAPLPSRYDNHYKALMLGYYGEGGSTQVYDREVATSMVSHSNYNFVTRDSNWDSNIRELPSLYLPSGRPPLWWGENTPWPAFGPDLLSQGKSAINKIPAQLRYEGAPHDVTVSVQPTSGD